MKIICVLVLFQQRLDHLQLPIARRAMRRRREFQQYGLAARERLIDRVLIHALVGLAIGRDARNIAADIGERLGVHARRRSRPAAAPRKIVKDCWRAPQAPRASPRPRPPLPSARLPLHDE
jgi:hypothetical protein